MTDQELIGYCEIHCQTERALFIGRHINRMIALAGYPKHIVRSVKADQWFTMRTEMLTLCELAKTRLKQIKEGTLPNNVIKFPVRDNHA